MSIKLKQLEKHFKFLINYIIFKFIIIYQVKLSKFFSFFSNHKKFILFVPLYYPKYFSIFYTLYRFSNVRTEMII